MSKPTASTAATADYDVTNAVWTVPNVISMIRVVLIVVFGWLFIAGHDLWAIGALLVAGASDFVDGFLARRWNQITHLGRMLDPAADRMLTIVVVVALAIRSVIPWWLVAIMLARDALMGIALLIARRYNVAPPRVIFLGKVATFALYVFLPLAFLGYERWDTVHSIAILGACAATALYWGSAIYYVRDIARRIRHTGSVRSSASDAKP